MGLKLCDDLLRAYWICREEAGFMVVLKCRAENSAMQRCVSDHMKDEIKYNGFRTKRLAELRVAAEAAAAAAAAGGAAAAGAPRAQ